MAKKQGLYGYPCPPAAGMPVDKIPPAARGESGLTTPCSWGTKKKEKKYCYRKRDKCQNACGKTATKPIADTVPDYQTSLVSLFSRVALPEISVVDPGAGAGDESWAVVLPTDP